MFLNYKSLRLEFIFLACVYSLLMSFFSDWFLLAHEEGAARFLSSDGAGYYQHYLNYIDAFGSANFTSHRFMELLFNKMPVVLLILFSGDVSLVITFSGLLAIFSIYVFMSKIESIVLRRRMFFLLFLIPFFSSGFFALNKEILIGSSTLLFLAYILSKDKRLFFLAIVIAAMGRPLFALVLALAFICANFFKLRYLIVLVLFAFFTFLPFSGINIPGAPDFQIHEDGGRFSTITTLIISNGGYVFVYPIKYLGNIILKIWTASSVNAFDRPTMYLDILTSITFLIQIWLVLLNRKLIGLFKVGRILLFLILVLPIPLLYFNFSQIRYIYFVQFFCIYLIASLPVYRKAKREF